jgi:hypothetical protein
MAIPAGTRVRVVRQARDRLGHWVTPPSQRGHPCHHACCQGRREHPEHLPVKLDRSYLRSLSEDEVYRELETYQRYSDTHEAGFLRIVAEATRREDSAERAQTRRQRARANRERATSDYRDSVYRQWLGAESVTNGYMLNAKGRAAGIDERSLFTGPQSRVDKYASEELRDFFLTNRRVTRQEYDERQRREMAAERERYARPGR